MTENNISESMIFFASIKDCIDALQLSAETKVTYYEGIINYGLYGIAPNFDNPVLNALFIALKPNMDANTRKKEQRIRDINNGKKGGRPRKNPDDKKSATAEEKISPVKTPMKNIDEPVKEENKNRKVHETENKETEAPKKDMGQERKEATVSAPSPHKYNNSISERNIRFYQSLIPYIDIYGTDAIQKFYDYWSESNPSGNHMRFEMEKTWDLDYRMERWIQQRKRLNL